MWSLVRPLPSIQPTLATKRLEIPASTNNINWPASGQAAVGIVGSDILETHGPQSPTPTASTAKIITALTVLSRKPLSLNQSGPLITLTTSDVALYNAYAAQQGSVVKVIAGEQISEYQILQTLLLPSANNMADSLAIWAFGSLPAYTAAANAYLAEHKLTHSNVGSDASGLSPTTTSTAHDLVILGELAMENPALAQIVGQGAATGIPVVNNIKNVNFLLGTANIVGVKTGNTDQAGGVFVSASLTTVNRKPVTIVTALAGVPSLFEAVNNSLPLIQSAQTNFKNVSVIKAGAKVGDYRLPWGGSVSATASKDLSALTWNGSSLSFNINLLPIMISSQAGQTTGQITTQKSAADDQQKIAIQLATAPTKPSVWWRLEHPVR